MRQRVAALVFSSFAILVLAAVLVFALLATRGASAPGL